MPKQSTTSRGRPRKMVNPRIVEAMARSGASADEIAEYCHASRRTIYRRFGTELNKGKAWRNYRLREMQMKAAEKLNPSMLIFLGKCDLCQTDKPAIVTVTSADVVDDAIAPPG